MSSRSILRNCRLVGPCPSGPGRSAACRRWPFHRRCLASVSPPAAAGLSRPGRSDSAGRSLAVLSFSSSLSGASGEGSVLVEHDEVDAAGHRPVHAGHVDAVGGRADVVLAVKNRYLPRLSNASQRTSLMPSVTWCFLPVGRVEEHAARRRLSSTLV